MNIGFFKLLALLLMVLSLLMGCHPTLHSPILSHKHVEKTLPPCHPGNGPPAHGYRAKCSYRYYPHLEVYYAPTLKIWYWKSRGEWIFGRRLPQSMKGKINDAQSVKFKLETNRPYTQHQKIKKRYGPKSKKTHPRKKKRKGKGLPIMLEALHNPSTYVASLPNILGLRPTV